MFLALIHSPSMSRQGSSFASLSTVLKVRAHFFQSYQFLDGPSFCFPLFDVAARMGLAFYVASVNFGIFPKQLAANASPVETDVVVTVE